jgi:acetyl esterase/lipase
MCQVNICSPPHVQKKEAYEVVGTRVISEDPEGNRWPFYLYTRQQGVWPIEVVGHDPDKEPKKFDPFCPVRNVTKDYPPTLLLHGEADTDVPIEQSVLMAKELERNKIHHELIVLANQGHGFDNEMQDPVITKTFERVLACMPQKVVIGCIFLARQLCADRYVAKHFKEKTF